MNLIEKLLPSEVLCILVYKNRFELSRLEDELAYIPFQSTTPFSSTRLVVGSFTEAEKFLISSIKAFFSQKAPTFSPIFFIQQLELCEGGLCEIEKRILKEVALGAGAKKVIIGPSEILTATEIKELVKNA